MTESITARVTGQVQGVGFRWTTVRELERLSLDGAAENLADGSVRVTATGARDSLLALVDWLNGPDTPGRVRGVDVTWGSAARWSTRDAMIDTKN